MRYLLITLIAAISIPTAVQANWLGKYGSRYEALEACKSWIKKGKVYFIEYETYLGWQKREVNNRRCQIESETNQFLGFEEVGVKDSETYGSNDSFKEKVKKYFKF